MRTDLDTRSLSSLKALLWDMDGTLVDTEPIWVRCEESLMAEFGYQWGQSDALHCIGGPMERVQVYLKEKSGSNLDPSWFGDRLIEMMLERLSDPSLEILKPGAQDLVEEVLSAGLKIALVSASRRSIVDAVLSALPFSFDFSISATEVLRSKPDPEGFLRASEKLFANIHSCVVIEDSPVGITSGLASGAMVVGLTEENYDHLNFHGINDLRDLSLTTLVDMHRSWLSRTQREGRS